MMTHEEIEAAIERLQAIEPSDYVGSAVVEVVWALMGGNVSAMELRDTMIDLLEQADPDEWADEQLRDYGLVRMPCDMDGELIYAGDKVYLGPPFAYCAWTVHSVTIDKNGVHDVCLVDDDGNERWFMPNTCTHHPPVTVESVLKEFAELCHECCDTPESIAEYAAKLREVMTDDDTR